MSLKEIKRRTAAALATGAPIVYPEHSGHAGLSTGFAPVLPCRHLTDSPLDRGGCGSCPVKWVYPCEVFGRCSPAGYHAGVKRCDGCEHRTPADAEKPEPVVRRLVLVNEGGPGEVLALSAALDSLHRAHPGRFVTAVVGPGAEFLAHGPNVVAADEVIDGKSVAWERVPILSSRNGPCGATLVGQMEEHCAFLAQALGVAVPLLVARPCVLLTPEEHTRPARLSAFTGERRYWLVGAEPQPGRAGWGLSDYQRLVDLLSDEGRVVQVGGGGSVPPDPPLRGALDLRAGLGSRELARAVAHAAGGVGGVGLLRLLCAAFDKPHVCVTGRQEGSLVKDEGPNRGEALGAPDPDTVARGETISPERVVAELLTGR